jgi:hypothetical protein
MDQISSKSFTDERSCKLLECSDSSVLILPYRIGSSYCKMNAATERSYSNDFGYWLREKRQKGPNPFPVSLQLLEC